MNEILAFTNNAFLCLKNLHRFELEDSCPASRLTDSKTANVAIVWISLAGLAVASFQLAKRLVAKKDPRMIQVFASRWQQVNPDQRYVPMNGLLTEKDCAYLQTIFQSWRLDTELCFFDVLGAQMHRNWKRAGVGKNDLRTFGQICATLSTSLSATTLYPYVKFGSDIKKSREQIEALGKQLPSVNDPELKIFLAALSDPQKTRVLGISAVDLFEESDVLGKGKSSRNDVHDFLEFAADMHPSFATLLVSDDKKRLHALNSLLTHTTEMESAAGLDRMTFLMQIKNLFEARIFEVKLPFYRLFENSFAIEKLEEMRPKDVRWIKQQYARFLGNQYLDKLAKMMTPSVNGLIRLDFSLGSLTDLRNAFRLLATFSRMQGNLKDLESAISYRLKSARKSIQNEEDYGNLFRQMVCLYQTVHDLRIVVDPSKNLLGESSCPSSISSLALLSSLPEKSSESDAVANNLSEKSSSTSQNPEHASNVSSEEEFPSSEEEEKDPSSIQPQQKIKTRPNKPLPPGKIPPAPPLPAFDETEDKTEMEKPYFPPRASPQEALQHLLDNGFVIERVRGDHYQLKHAITHTPTTVPLSGDRLKTGTLHSIRNAFYQSQGF